MIKRQSMKLLIAESLMELAEHKPIEKISVNDIVENCGISRGSFYKNFADKFEVIEWICEENCYEIVNEFAAESLALSCMEMFKYFSRNIDFYKGLSRRRNTEVSDIIFDVTYRVMTDFIVKNYHLDKISDDEKFIFSCYNRGSVYMIIEWINDPKPCPAEKMADLITRSWPIGLMKYLNLPESSFNTIL